MHIDYIENIYLQYIAKRTDEECLGRIKIPSTVISIPITLYRFSLKISQRKKKALSPTLETITHSSSRINRDPSIQYTLVPAGAPMASLDL